MKFNPTFDRVVIKPAAPKEKSAGGIVLPESYGTGERALVGEVVAVGPGTWHPGGSFVLVGLRPGDKVIYTSSVGIDIEVDGVKLLVMPEDSVLGVLSE